MGEPTSVPTGREYVNRSIVSEPTSVITGGVVSPITLTVLVTDAVLLAESIAV